MAERAARLLVALSLLLAAAAGRTADNIPAASVVRFNTVCANCHEGECSGRLSFSTGATAARGHMQRYLGALSDGEAEKLFAVLRHTKEECSHYPLASPFQPTRALKASELSAWQNPYEGGYFIPLGSLLAIEYRLRINLSVAGNGQLKITDSRFEPVIDEPLCPGNKSLEFRFQGSATQHFLTIKAPVMLDSITLEAAGGI